MPWTCIHMLMHNATVLSYCKVSKGKSCIHNVHAFVIWSCLGLMIIIILMPWMMTCFDWLCDMMLLQVHAPMPMPLRHDNISSFVIMSLKSTGNSPTGWKSPLVTTWQVFSRWSRSRSLLAISAGSRCSRHNLQIRICDQALSPDQMEMQTNK